jgi:hypothetical protein
MELSKVGFNSPEGFVLLKTEELLVELTPLQIVHPVGGIWLLVNVSGRPCQEVSPFVHVDLFSFNQNLHTEKEGEK